MPPPTPKKSAPAPIAPSPADSAAMVAQETTSPAPAERPISEKGVQFERDTFGAEELAIVLSHYDLNIIESIAEFPKGSRRAPKLLVKTVNGAYLLKRRARGKDDPFKVAFCHQLQIYLASKQFPLPHLIGTKADSSMLQIKGAIYECFEYIKGNSYDNGVESTGESGRILGLFHKLLQDYKPEYDPPRGSFHDSGTVRKAMDHIPGTLRKLDPQGKRDYDEVDKVVGALREHYNTACKRVEDMGISEWPAGIVHSDWHPGNTLYRGPKVVAVIDYDTSRIQQRIVDVGNGALQFSITHSGHEDPTTWPDSLDEKRFRSFVRGYDQVYKSTPEFMLSVAELRTIPWLMVEALISEAVIPIANAGSFARMDGMIFLRMVLRKANWVRKHYDRLVQLLEG